MATTLKLTKDWPILAGRRFDIMHEGQMVGRFFKANGRWMAELPRNRAEVFDECLNRTSYQHSNFHAMVRLIACYIEGDMERIPFLMRGIWTNPCPTAVIEA